MEEKTFKLMGSCGTMNIVFGVLAIVSGVTAGVMLIVSGARLLTGRK